MLHLALATEEQLALANADEPIERVADEVDAGQVHDEALHDLGVSAVFVGEPEGHGGIEAGKDHGVR